MFNDSCGSEPHNIYILKNKINIKTKKSTNKRNYNVSTSKYYNWENQNVVCTVILGKKKRVRLFSIHLVILFMSLANILSVLIVCNLDLRIVFFLLSSIFSFILMKMGSFFFSKIMNLLIFNFKNCEFLINYYYTRI